VSHIKPLPKGWTFASFPDIAEINPVMPSIFPADTQLVTFLPMASVDVLSGRIDTSANRAWQEVKKGYTRFQENDVLFAKITPCMENGKAAVAHGLLGGVGAGSTEFHVLRANSLVTSHYLLLFILQEKFRSSARAAMTGTAGQLRVPARFLESQKIPLPPLPEQYRIVSAAESYLTRLDDAMATLERVQRNLKRYRASVIKAAVEGRLVPTEGELAREEGREYEPASVLLERILAERRRRWEEAELAKMKAKGKVPKNDTWKAKYVEPAGPDMSELPELPEGWCWSSIDQLSQLVRNGFTKKPGPEGRVRILRISAVRAMRIDFGDCRWLPGDPEDYDADLVHEGDLLFTRYNGTPALVGVSGLARVVDRPTVHPDKIIKVRPIKLLLNLSYLELSVNTGISRRFIESRIRTTAGQAGVSGGDVKKIPVPLPPLAEQNRIIDEQERILAFALSTSNALTVSRARGIRLRQSILKWAFEGRLVDQDPSDEPANVLLERIRAERAAGNGKNQPRPRRVNTRSATA
jgi:type I restriction enzyme S subunit